MVRRPPVSTPTYTLLPYPTLFRSRLDPSSFRHATILVAEGNRGLRRALRDVLLGMGFPVIHVAGTMAETQRQVMQQSPGVILLDHKLDRKSTRLNSSH